MRYLAYLIKHDLVYCATKIHIRKYFIVAMPKDKRHEIQRQWMGGWVPVICATISFGMGIDKSSVR